MQYNRVFYLQYVDLSLKDLEYLKQIIYNMFKNIKTTEKSISVLFADETQISDSSFNIFEKTIFLHKEIVEIFMNVSNNKNSIIIEINPKKYSYIRLSSYDENFYNKNCNIIFDYINSLNLQSIIFKGYLIPALKIKYIFLLFSYYFVSFFILGTSLKIVPSLIMKNNFFFFIAIILFLTFLFYELFNNAFPNVALDFGSKQNKVFHIYRKLLKGIFFTIIIPIILEIYLHFLL